MVLLALSVCSRIIDKFCFSNALSLLVSQLQSFYSSAFSSLPIRRLAYILQHQYERITLQSLPAFAQSWQPAHRLSALSLQHPSLALTATYNSAQFQFTAQLGQIGLQCQSQASTFSTATKIDTHLAAIASQSSPAQCSFTTRSCQLNLACGIVYSIMHHISLHHLVRTSFAVCDSQQHRIVHQHGYCSHSVLAFASHS